MATNIDTGQLYTLYLNWKADPKRYGQEMAETVDKIIRSTVSRQSLMPVYRRFEDSEDLIQDLRYLCFKKLQNIENPSNKRIFNYLRVSISLALKDKARKVGKRMDREPIEASTLGEKKDYDTSYLSFGDPLLDQIAIMLANKESKQAIVDQLGIDRLQLDKQINKLKCILGKNNV